MARAPAISATRKARSLRSSGSVFADIGLRNAEKPSSRQSSRWKIDRLLRARNLKQIEAAKLFGSKQPDISKMPHGDFRQFWVERLPRFLMALGQDEEIVVGEHRKAREHRNGKGSLALPVA